MKKLIAATMAAMLLLAPVAAAAQAIDTSGLTAAQVAEINAQVEREREKAQSTPEQRAEKAVEKVNEWAEIGEGIGTGLAAAARETGTVVNEFATTPVGKMVTVVIIYKVMGKEILKVLIGVPVLIAYIVLWVLFTRRLLVAPIREEFNEAGKRVARYRDIDNHPLDDPESRGVAWALSWIALVLVSGIIIFAVIL